MTLSLTKEERFILRLQEIALSRGSEEEVVNRYDVGHAMGLTSKSTDAICQVLLRTNFIKKTDDEGIFITKHGLNLIATLKRE